MARCGSLGEEWRGWRGNRLRDVQQNLVLKEGCGDVVRGLGEGGALSGERIQFYFIVEAWIALG